MSKQIVINLNSQSFSLSSWRNHLSLSSGFVFLSFSRFIFFFCKSRCCRWYSQVRYVQAKTRSVHLFSFFALFVPVHFHWVSSTCWCCAFDSCFQLGAVADSLRMSVCICWCRPVARPTYQHEYVPSSVHTRINGFAFENKFHHFVPVSVSVYRLMLNFFYYLFGIYYDGWFFVLLFANKLIVFDYIPHSWSKTDVFV